MKSTTLPPVTGNFLKFPSEQAVSANAFDCTAISVTLSNKSYLKCVKSVVNFMQIAGTVHSCSIVCYLL